MKWTLLVALGIAANIILIITIQNMYTDRIGYVKLSEVYDNFKLTKTLNDKYNSTKSKQIEKLDSLKLFISLQRENINIKNNNQLKNYEELYNYYLKKNEEFEKTDAELLQRNQVQIWNQINTYVSDYGKLNNYTFIYGINGDGNLMYASDNRDITSEVIEFVNQKYENK